MRLFLFFVLLGLFSFSCATQKQKGDVSKFKKFYHNTTALYNGYFNANVLLEESFLSLENQVTDNYNQPLEVFKYAAAENPQSVYENLDRAIEKVSVVVHLHRVSNWTDDSYLLMGKAQFLKQDYESAQETFEYFIQEFDEEGESKSKKKRVRKAPAKSNKKARAAKARTARKEIKAKERAEEKARKEREKERKKEIRAREKGRSSGKKIDAREARAIREARREQARQDSIAAVAATQKKDKDNNSTVAESFEENDDDSFDTFNPDSPDYDPDSYFMKHKPAYQEGLLWLAKTYVMRANYDNARMYLKQLENSPKTFQEIRAEVSATEAYSFIRQKNYVSAIQPLKNAVALSKNREDRARYAYILAQLQEINGQYRDAVASFEKVIKMRPGFEMEFHSRMGAIRTQQLSGSVQPDAVANEIKRMLRERKFEEFKGELYLTMAVIKLNGGNKKEGIESLKLALAEGRNNASTNAEVHYLLGNLFFESEDYVSAKTHYDGVVTTMNKNDERFPIAEKRANSLTEIADNIKIISDKDSLLTVANLSDEAKLELAKEIKKKNEADLLTDIDPDKGKGGSAPVNFVATGNRAPFFAYDQKNLRKNQNEFDKLWQARPLEDNWRRSNKNTSSFDQEDDVADLRRPKRNAEISDKELEDLLAGVPNSPEAVASANNDVMEAMYALGGLFRDKLDRTEQSVNYLEQLLERFPGNPHEADAYYRLYINYQDLGDLTKSEYYKNLIINNHPQSLYAEVILDPDYFKKKREEENKLNNYYASTYASFTGGDFEKAYDMSNQATQVFGAENNLKAKFALLRAMCVGKLQGSDAYMLSLREVIARYPDSEEQIRAREILRLLGQRVGGGTPQSTAADTATIYKISDDELHYVIVVIQSNDLTLNDAKVKISNYNNKYHRLDQLKISNIVLGEKNNLPVVVLRRFENKAMAMKYFEGTNKNKKDFISDPSHFEMYAISQTNYRQLVTSRSIEPYREFFMKTYL